MYVCMYVCMYVYINMYVGGWRVWEEKGGVQKRAALPPLEPDLACQLDQRERPAPGARASWGSLVSTFTYPCFYLSIYQSIYQSIYLSIYPYIYIYICEFICIHIYTYLLLGGLPGRRNVECSSGCGTLPAREASRCSATSRATAPASAGNCVRNIEGVSLSIYIYTIIYLSIYLYIYPSIHLSIYLYLSIYIYRSCVRFTDSHLDREEAVGVVLHDRLACQAPHQLAQHLQICTT